MADVQRIIRPAAVVPARAALAILDVLRLYDVSRGGVWNASSTVWQRYDRPWDGPLGTRGTARLVGTIAVVYDRPTRHDITIYKVTVTTEALASGWTVDRLCDDALAWVGLRLADCPRIELPPPPPPDPFHRRVPPQRPGVRPSAQPTQTRRTPAV